MTNFYYIYAIISGILMGFSDIVQKYTYDLDMNYISHLTLSFGLVYILLLFVFLGIIFIFNYNKQVLNVNSFTEIININSKLYKYVLLISLLSFFALIFTLLAIKKCTHIPYTIAIISGTINITALLLSYFVFKKKISANGLLGVGLILAGSSLIILFN